MNLLYTPCQFEKSKSRDLLPLLCEHCKSTYYLTKHRIQNKILSISDSTPFAGSFCSLKCSHAFELSHSRLTIKCKECSKLVSVKKTKLHKNHFCSQSCAARFNNKNKKFGCRRSKLEVWLEQQLLELYPTLEIHFNRKDTINSELDIYIPSLKLAFELNGIFHYEPIYGKEKLNEIQNNDNRKFQACLENGIELCIIDTSHQAKFSEKSSEKYLTILKSLINSKN
jgi:frataxin-like iron-binding protein CyaY